MNSIDKVIQIIRENMVANAPGTGGGFSGSADKSGPVAGYDPGLGKLDGRSRVMRKLPKEYSKFLRNKNSKGK